MLPVTFFSNIEKNRQLKTLQLFVQATHSYYHLKEQRTLCLPTVFGCVLAGLVVGAKIEDYNY